jgi:hypothetical protein
VHVVASASWPSHIFVSKTGSYTLFSARAFTLNAVFHTCGFTASHRARQAYATDEAHQSEMKLLVRRGAKTRLEAEI